MERKRWKQVAISVGTLVVLTLLLLLVFRGHYREMLADLRALRGRDLLLLLGMGMLYQLLESKLGHVLVRGRMPEYTYRQAVMVNFLRVFGDTSTFSVGSIPLQSYYLHRCGLMPGSGVGLTTLQYVFHKSAVLVYATVLLLVDGWWLAESGAGLGRYVLLGYGICALIIAALILLCTWKRVLQLALWVLERLPDTEKWQCRRKNWSENLQALYAESQRTFRDRRRCGKVLVFEACKLFCLYTIPWLCFRMLGVTALSFRRVQLLAALMYLITGALPNVAGMGPAEFAFLLIFSAYMAYAQASAAMLLFRVATFFFPFVVSVFVFLRVEKQVVRETLDGADPWHGGA